jgi:hypothetical protein
MWMPSFGRSPGADVKKKKKKKIANILLKRILST